MWFHGDDLQSFIHANIVNSAGLASVLSCFPVDKRRAIVDRYQDKITNIIDMCKVVANLAAHDRLAFVVTHQEKIKTSDQLFEVAALLDDESRAGFLAINEGRVKLHEALQSAYEVGFQTFFIFPVVAWDLVENIIMM